MGKKVIVDRVILKDHTEVHPALDFYNGKAIVSVARPGVTKYDDGSAIAEQYSVCVTSEGESFIMTINELLNRKLYYLKELDVALDRWGIDDQEQFLQQLKNGSKPTVNLQEIHVSLKSLCIDLFDFNDSKLYDFFPTFIIYTYFFPLFESAPVLHLWGPAGSGKTKIMELMGLTCFNPVTSGNITEAGVFRLVEGRRGVCLLDESEDLSKTERGHAITNLILNGYRKGNLVYRMDKVGKTISSSHYNVFSPKVIANIAGIDKEALMSRAIRVVTSSTRNNEKANRYTAEAKEQAVVIRNQLYRACLLKFTDITEAKDNMPSVGLTGRSAEIWQGVLTIAWCVGGETWHNVSWLAIESSKAMQTELVSSNPVWDLLEVLLDFVERGKPKFYTSEAINQYLSNHRGETFGGKKQITQTLKQQGFQSVERRVKGRVCRGMILDRSTILEKLNFLTGTQFEIQQ